MELERPYDIANHRHQAAEDGGTHVVAMAFQIHSQSEDSLRIRFSQYGSRRCRRASHKRGCGRPQTTPKWYLIEHLEGEGVVVTDGGARRAENRIVITGSGRVRTVVGYRPLCRRLGYDPTCVVSRQGFLVVGWAEVFRLSRFQSHRLGKRFRVKRICCRGVEASNELLFRYRR